MGLLGTTQTGMVEELSSCGGERFTGCVYVVDKANSQTGRIYFRDGSVYAAQVDGFLPRIARRLRTAGVLTQDTYAEVVKAHSGDDTDPALGGTCLSNGLTDQDTLDALNREFVLSAVGAIVTWPGAKVKAKKSDTTDLFLIKPVSVEKIMNAIAKRQEYGGNLWEEIGAGTHVGSVVPTRTTKPRVPSGDPTPDLDAFFAFVDGKHTLDQIAGELGLTRFEAVHMLHTLITEGTVAVPKAAAPLSRSVTDPQTASVPDYEVGTHTLLVIPAAGLNSHLQRIEADSSSLLIPSFDMTPRDGDAQESSVFGAPAVAEEAPDSGVQSDGYAAPVESIPAPGLSIPVPEWEDVRVEDAQEQVQDADTANEWVNAVAAAVDDEPVAARQHDDTYSFDTQAVEWQEPATDPAAADRQAANEWVEAVETAPETTSEDTVTDQQPTSEWVPVGEGYTIPVPAEEVSEDVADETSIDEAVEETLSTEAEINDTVVDDPAVAVEDAYEVVVPETIVAEEPVEIVEEDEYEVYEIPSLEPVAADSELVETADVDAVEDAASVADETVYVAPVIEAPIVLDDEPVEFMPLHAAPVEAVEEVAEAVAFAAAPLPDPSALIQMPAPIDPDAELKAQQAAEREQRRALLTQSLTAIEETLRRQEERARTLRSDVEQSLALKTTLNNVLSDAQMLHSQTKHAFDQAQEVFRQAEEVYTQVERDLAAADTRRQTAVTRLANAQDAVTATTSAREQAEAAVRAAHEEFLRRVNAYNQTVQEYEAASREVNEADSFYRQVEQALEQVKPQRDMYYQQYGAALRGTETAQARLQSAEMDYSRAQETYDAARREFREVEDEVRGLKSELQDVRALLADLDA